MTEDKQKILYALLVALKQTRDLYDLVDLTYQPAQDMQFVIAKFTGGGTRKINVTLDSGVAMIRDVMEELR